MRTLTSLYYLEYKFDDTYGESYFIDTGFGILEVGTVENNTIYENLHLAYELTVNAYLKNFTGTVLSCTKVL